MSGADDLFWQGWGGLRKRLAEAEQRATRSERELERWRLRLRDRARRRKEETEGDHGFDWLASRERIHAYREKLDAELRRDGRAWALESQAPAMPRAIMANLQERVRLPGDVHPEDIAERHVCPGCHAVDEPCLPGCIDAEIAADRERERSSGPAWEDEEDDP